MGLRFCPSEEVETLDRSKFCGDPGFLRYCCSPQNREFPQELKEPEDSKEQEEEGRCSKNSDCPETQIPSGLEVDTLPDVKVYQCKDSYECDDDYGSCIKEKTCQTEYVPFCTHPKGKNYPECEVKDSDPVYTLNKDGNIECKLDSDCPPTAQPSWEWNETTKMENGVTSITEMAIIVPVCSQQSVVFGDYGFGDYGSGDYGSGDYRSRDYGSGDNGSGDYGSAKICEEKRKPFCGHEYGRSHPECQRCNVLTPLPEPECIDFDLRLFVVTGDVDRCCSDLFNDTLVEELKAEEDDKYYDPQIDLREEILQNFTMTDCRLSVLHLPQNASPRTSFEWENICCSFAQYCFAPAAVGTPLSFASAVTGIGSLNRKSLASQNSGPFSCPFGHCKRPSLARPGKIICCLLIRTPWGRRRIAICPNSCD